ncbi:MAG: DNA-3-methyladenine glycosylase [Caulobacteraceae bacterium]
MKKLNRDFYMRDTLIVARELLGTYLVHETSGHKVMGRIVETEAYIGPEDKGSHSYGGKRTKRTEVMYHIGGTSYVYLIYGMYYCFNVVTEQVDKPSAVLIRAVEPVGGEDIMSRLRYGLEYSSLSSKQKINIANGPGKLCTAMGIGKAENDLDLCGKNLYICEAPGEKFTIRTSPRVNINYAEEYIHMPWRFYIDGNKYVSQP